ncbi:MAG: rhodanese-like domain-containing protein [Flavobacteriales bacterium]|nr:rhodanese-like domain-containing protein [Flavobacteriales bacterium]MCB9168391.1 rhodanese-like domain-containing protein [Flavobacteriales bacterium]
MQHTLLIAACFGPLLLNAQTGAVDGTPAPPTTVQELTPAQLSALMTAGRVFVFDCNEPYMHEEAHVPGAVLIPYDAVTPDRMPADRDAAIVFYCYSPECPAASMAARDAVELGFTQVYCMREGITGWQDVGLPTEAVP